MKKIFTIVFLLTATHISAEDQAGTQSPFSLGVGSRDLALGGAFLADPSYATSLYWNPAALTAVPQVCLTGFYTRLFQSGISYQYFGAVIPTLRLGTFAAGVSRIGVNDIEARDGSNLSLGTFDDSRTDFRFGYGRTIANTSFGANVHFEHQSLYHTSFTTTPGFDLGASRQFTTSSRLFPRFAFALVSRNLVDQSLTSDGEKVVFPSTIEGGTTVLIEPWGPQKVSTAFSFAAVQVSHLDPTFRVGAEMIFASILAIRSGWRDESWTVGLGLTWKGYSFDYALLKQDLDDLHLFSLSVAVGPTKQERRERRQQREEERLAAESMNRLIKQHGKTVDSLLSAADSAEAAMNLPLAENCLSRALFFAAMAGRDTSAIAEHHRQMEATLQTQMRQKRIAALEDTTRMAAADSNWQAVHYYADLILADSLNHERALAWKQQATQAISQLNSRELLLTTTMNRADSLLATGQIASALAALYMAQSLAPDDQKLREKIADVHSELLERQIKEALELNSWDLAQLLLDSANVLFPSEAWIDTLANHLANEKKALVAKSAPAPTPVPVPTAPPAPSKEAQQQATKLYAEAARLFSEGELHRSILIWKQVEELIPDFKDTHNRLFEAYKYVGIDAYGHNNLESAVAAWKDALRFSQGNKEVSEYIRRAETELARRNKLASE